MRFDQTVQDAAAAVHRAYESVHRAAEVSLGETQASLDRKLLKLTVLALVVSSIFSGLTVLLSLRGPEPIELEGPIIVTLVEEELERQVPAKADGDGVPDALTPAAPTAPSSADSDE